MGDWTDNGRVGLWGTGLRKQGPAGSGPRREGWAGGGGGYGIERKCGPSGDREEKGSGRTAGNWAGKAIKPLGHMGQRRKGRAMEE